MHLAGQNNGERNLRTRSNPRSTDRQTKNQKRGSRRTRKLKTHTLKRRLFLPKMRHEENFLNPSALHQPETRK